ncbi:hypothetical protein [Nocardioides mangrovi]|uniref:GH26 domain-containing protein n=1 Tax=Nocardioides mangrovi TaxID=2874580 RepID=A0ABS7UGE1_9ACTN|nr:hypothetical protein [Nocardioides mangrovi]MBZ5739746.1 hypothetical protein [Nocardioides mangrovi]
MSTPQHRAGDPGPAAPGAHAGHRRAERAPRPTLRSRGLPAVLAVTLVVTGIVVGAVHLGGSGDRAWASTVVKDNRISVLAGVARSTYDRDAMWTVGTSAANAADGGAILAVDTSGATVAHVDITGDVTGGWQDISAGPGHTLWIAGVARVWKHATVVPVFSISEPSDLAQTSARATRYKLRIPSREKGVQSLLVQPRSGRVYLATDRDHHGKLYVAPEKLSSTTVNRVEKVAKIPAGISGGTFGTRGDGLVLVDDDTTYLYAAPGADPSSRALPDEADPTGVSVDRRGRTLLVSSSRNRAIYRIPLAPDDWPTIPGVTLPTLPIPSSTAPTTSPTPTPTRTPTPTPTPTPTRTPTPTTSPTQTTQPTPSGTMGIGMYSGSFSYESFKSDFATYPAVETTYLNADQVTTPNISRHEAQIDHGISPVITLGYKNGPFTRAQIAAWGSDVQAYFKEFVAGLKTLSDYAAKADNGTHVYFADEHEAQIKINQDKYAYSAYGSSQKPTTQDSAAAWNKVMGYVRTAAPDVVRTYWYGGSGANEDTYASLLEPSLIQMATFDPYRWRHDSASDTPQSLWGSKISSLKSKSWMKNADGSLKPWGLTEWGTDASLGDSANATFITNAMDYLRQQGASFAVYFNRVDGNDTTNDFVITDGSQPKSLAAFRAEVQQ